MSNMTKNRQQTTMCTNVDIDLVLQISTFAMIGRNQGSRKLSCPESMLGFVIVVVVACVCVCVCVCCCYFSRMAPLLREPQNRQQGQCPIIVRLGVFVSDSSLLQAPVQLTAAKRCELFHGIAQLVIRYTKLE